MAKTKVCKDCKKEKAHSQFYVSKRIGGRVYLASYCKQCQVALNHKNDAKRGAKNRLRLWEWFQTHPCVDCGEDNPIVLELDHVRGKKRDAVSTMMKEPWARIMAEVAKCEVRCGNCHRIKTAASLGHYDTESLRDYASKWPANKRAFYLHGEDS